MASGNSQTIPFFRMPRRFLGRGCSRRLKIPRNRHGNDFVIPLVAGQRYLAFEGCI